MTKIASAKQKRQRPVEDEAEMLNPLHYENEVLHVYSTPLKPHADFPWLWSTSSLLNAVLKYQRGNGVGEAALAKFKKAKSPRKWVASQERTPTRWNKEVRVAGRLQKQEIAISGCTQMYTPKLLNDYAIQKINGGRHQGTYLCASLIVAYCRFLHPEFGALVDDFFARGLQGSNSVIVEVRVNADKNRPAKGTVTREDSLSQWGEWRDWNDEVGASHIVTLGEVTSATLGTTRKKYMADKGIGEPFRDNVDEGVLKAIVTGQAATMQYGSRLRVQGQHETSAVARGVCRMLKRISDRVQTLEDLENILP